MKPLFKIKVFPGRFNPFIRHSHYYYHVLIFETKQDMWDAGAKLSSFEKDECGGYGALTVPLRRQKIKNGQLIKVPCIGTVLFYKDLLGSSVISHESVHMATSYLRIINQLKLSDQIDDDEEKLAYCVGSCMRQIVNNLYKRLGATAHLKISKHQQPQAILIRAATHRVLLRK